MNAVVEGECGTWNLGSLILSLGITLILVGALFYYVKQRIEVLETSQKEQIHVMQSFIASIGNQFQRMNAYVQEKIESVVHGSSKASEPASAPAPVPASTRIDISESSDSDSSGSSYSSDSSDSSDSDYDNGSEYSESRSSNSRSSNTTRDSYPKQIKIHEAPQHAQENATSSNVNMDNIKVIEITPEQLGSGDANALDDDMASSSSHASSSDTDSADSGDSSDSEQLETTSHSTPIHVTKKAEAIEDIEELVLDDIIHTNTTTSSNTNSNTNTSSSPTQKKTLVIDLDGGNGDEKSNQDTTNSSEGPQYSSLNIKQLRQLLKKKNPTLLMNDISKMKREQIVEMLQ